MDNLIGIVIFLSVILAIEVSNFITLRRVYHGSILISEPMVSVLIPARNEELNIRECVVSVLSQDYDNYELLVLDDNSEDKTHDILISIMEETKKLKVLRGAELPAGWAGKNWACHQLSEAANGELLLFIDADTRMKNGCIRSLSI